MTSTTRTNLLKEKSTMTLTDRAKSCWKHFCSHNIRKAWYSTAIKNQERNWRTSQRAQERTRQFSRWLSTKFNKINTRSLEPWGFSPVSTIWASILKIWGQRESNQTIVVPYGKHLVVKTVKKVTQSLLRKARHMCNFSMCWWIGSKPTYREACA